MTTTADPADDAAGAVDDLEQVAARLRLSTTRLARRLRSEADMGMTPSLLSALATIHVHGPLPLGELAELEGVSKPTVTKVVGRLEDSGLVARRPDAEDRRICRVQTTVAGDELLAASRRRKNAWLAARLTAIDPDRRDRLAAALDVLDELVAGEPR